MRRRRGDRRVWGGSFWAAPHRPLFLAAAVWAIVGVGFLPVFGTVWHAHEMLFGFIGAAVGGYLLTALPGWTGAPPLRGSGLVGLVAVWGLARGAALCDPVPPVILIPLTTGYFVALAGILLRAVIRAKAWRKIGFGFVVIALGIADAAFWINAPAGGLEIARAGILMIAGLAAVIGQKAVPAFTANWLAVRGIGGPRPRGHLGWVIAAIAAAWISPPLSAGLLLASMRGWRGMAIRREPLLLALHFGYACLPVGLALLGLNAGLASPISPTGPVHFLAIGALAGLIFALAGRAAAHREGGGLRAAAGFSFGAGLIGLAALIRQAEQGAPLAGVLWCLGWALFLRGFIPTLRAPPPRPALSGARAETPSHSGGPNR